MLQDLKSKIVKSSFTHVSLSIVLKAINFGQALLFARIFTPSELGSLATAILVVSFITLFTETKFDQLIIRQKEEYENTMNTAFTIYFAICALSFIILLVISPYTARVFHNSDLSSYICFLSFLLFENMLGLPRVIWIKHFRFGINKIPNFVSIVATCSIT